MGYLIFVVLLVIWFSPLPDIIAFNYMHKRKEVKKMDKINNCLECPFWKFIGYGLNDKKLYDCCVKPFEEEKASNICIYKNRFVDEKKD